MEWVALVMAVLALGGFLDVTARRWPELDTLDRIERWGWGLLLAGLVYGLVEVHTDSRIRFAFIALAMAYLLAAYVTRRVTEIRSRRRR